VRVWRLRYCSFSLRSVWVVEDYATAGVKPPQLKTSSRHGIDSMRGLGSAAELQRHDRFALTDHPDRTAMEKSTTAAAKTSRRNSSCRTRWACHARPAP